LGVRGDRRSATGGEQNESANGTNHELSSGVRRYLARSCNQRDSGVGQSLQAGLYTPRTRHRHLPKQ
jgi:hypothetical protein